MDSVTTGLIGISVIGLIGTTLVFLWLHYRKSGSSGGSVPVGYGAGESWRAEEIETAPLLSPRIEEPEPPSGMSLPLRFRVRLPDEPVPPEFQRLEGASKSLVVIPELHLDRVRGMYRLYLMRIPVGEPVPPGVIPVYTVFASRDWQKNACLDFDVPGHRALLTNLGDGNSVVSLSVNGEKMAPNERRVLKIGDWIRIGDSPRPADYSQKRYRVDLQLVSDRTMIEG